MAHAATTTYGDYSLQESIFMQEGKEIKCISSFTCVFVVHFPFQNYVYRMFLNFNRPLYKKRSATTIAT